MNSQQVEFFCHSYCLTRRNKSFNNSSSLLAYIPCGKFIRLLTYKMCMRIINRDKMVKVERRVIKDRNVSLLLPLSYLFFYFETNCCFCIAELHMYLTREKHPICSPCHQMEQFLNSCADMR